LQAWRGLFYSPLTYCFPLAALECTLLCFWQLLHCLARDTQRSAMPLKGVLYSAMFLYYRAGHLEAEAVAAASTNIPERSVFTGKQRPKNARGV
jgi:hypothetical protein